MDSTQDQSNKTLVVEKGMRIEMVVNGYLQTWDVVGGGQSDTVRKIISKDAPLIQLIWKMGEGESIVGQFGSRELNVEIKKISVTPKRGKVW